MHNGGGGELRIGFERNFTGKRSIGAFTGLTYDRTETFTEKYTITTAKDTYLKLQPSYYAIPVSLYYKFPIERTGMHSLRIGAGLDYYMAKVKYLFSTTGSKSTQDFKASGIGWHMYSGWQWKFHKFLSVVTELRVPMATIDEYESDLSQLIMKADSQLPGSEEVNIKSLNSAITAGERPFEMNYTGIKLNVGVQFTF
ncbi:hypothetical protein ACFL6Y_02245 [Elusimicrobiota bacterium]